MFNVIIKNENNGETSLIIQSNKERLSNFHQGKFLLTTYVDKVKHGLFLLKQKYYNENHWDNDCEFCIMNRRQIKRMWFHSDLYQSLCQYKSYYWRV